MQHLAVVLDTNIFVAAGFNRGSRSAQLLKLLRQGRLRLVWNQATRQETRLVVEKIPPLDWEEIAGLFSSETEFLEPTSPDTYSIITDPDDRKFAALAAAAGAYLVSNDDHLLSVREELDLQVCTPAELFERIEGPDPV
jgi:uncharacterized protein